MLFWCHFFHPWIVQYSVKGSFAEHYIRAKLLMATQKPCKWAVREAHPSSCQMNLPLLFMAIIGLCFLRQWLYNDGSDDDSTKPNNQLDERKRESLHVKQDACIRKAGGPCLHDAKMVLKVNHSQCYEVVELHEMGSTQILMKLGCRGEIYKLHHLYPTVFEKLHFKKVAVIPQRLK